MTIGVADFPMTQKGMAGPILGFTGLASMAATVATHNVFWGLTVGFGLSSIHFTISAAAQSISIKLMEKQ